MLVLIMISLSRLTVGAPTMTENDPCTENASYSLWLVPCDDSVRDKFTAIISSIADAYDAPAFAPHVTLISRLTKHDLGTLRNLSTDPIAFRVLPESQHFDTWNQHVILPCDRTEALENLHREACRLLDRTPGFAKPSEIPHLSLMYNVGGASASVPDDLRERIGGDPIACEWRVVAVDASGVRPVTKEGVEAWHEVDGWRGI
eukprot:GEMP01102876.1.p1 GENE.GEMP01102876.1~~GEMP01102876.1.p1  ORF type:complete len:203 (+),score=37.64 GEMP01102876.1:158-766(+)